jgi:hypothetical protein
MRSRVAHERWVGCHLSCDVIVDDLAVLGVTASSASVRPWFNPAIPEDVRNEIEKAVLALYRRRMHDIRPADKNMAPRPTWGHVARLKVGPATRQVHDEPSLKHRAECATNDISGSRGFRA